MKATSLAAVLVALAAGPAWSAAPARTARPAAQRPALPFIHDDYARALAQARSRKLPLFIDAWAPW